MEISVALGGGAIRGLAHIGILEKLEANGFTIKAVAGTSVGGLIGSVVAAGYSPQELQKILAQINMSTLYRRRPQDGASILGTSGLYSALTGLLGAKTFDDLRIPFACTAVDINSSREVYLTQGRVVDAVLATIAFPGVLPPVQRGDALLVDGGVLDPVPVLLARRLAPDVPVLAICLNPAADEWDKNPEGNLFEASSAALDLPVGLVQSFSKIRLAQAIEIFARSMDISMRLATELRLLADKPDFVLRPNVYKYNLFEMVDPSELIEIGRNSLDEALPQIHQAFSWRGKVDRLIRTITPIETPGIIRTSLNPNDEHPEPDI